MRINTTTFKKKYLKLLKIKRHFEKHSKSIIKKHRFTLFTNTHFRLNENEINIMIKEKFHKYKTIYKKYRIKSLLNIRWCFKVTVSLYEYLQVNYHINIYDIISYIKNINNWYYPKLTLINIPIKEELLKNKNNSQIISNNIKKTLYNKLHQIYNLPSVLNNDPEKDWHIDSDYNSSNNNDILVLSQSTNKKLGTQYYEIPKLNYSISCNNELLKSIYQCCDKLSITWLNKNKRFRSIPENTISNIPSIYYHRSPPYNPDIQRTIWLFESL